jgi:hypothetical protein
LAPIAACGGEPEDAVNWPLAKRFYRFVWSQRFDRRQLLKGLYRFTQRTVGRCSRPYLVVAIDPVNFEKPSRLTWKGSRQS